MSTIIVPARYGSSRFPGKVLEKIGKTPMIVMVAEQCSKTVADRVIVATDDERVAVEVERAGFACVMTPSSLPTGTDRIALAAASIDDNIIINVQGDEPFIPPALINTLIKELENDPALLMNTACVPFGKDEDFTDSAKVKVVMDREGYAMYFSRAAIPFSRDGRECIRYKHIGIYGFKKDFLLKYSLMKSSGIEETEMLEQLRALENGIKIKVTVTDYTPVAVDNKEDLEFARQYYKSLVKEQ